MKLYDTKAIARILDLSARRVRQLRDKGVIEEHKGSLGLYDLTSTNHKYINYLRQRNPESEENIDYNTERAKFVRAKRRDVEFDLKVKEGDLHTSADIEAAMTNMLIIFKSRLMAIPSKLSPILSKKTDKAEIFRIIKDSVDEALNELADYDRVFAERLKNDMEGKAVEGTDT